MAATGFAALIANSQPATPAPAAAAPAAPVVAAPAPAATAPTPTPVNGGGGTGGFAGLIKNSQPITQQDTAKAEQTQQTTLATQNAAYANSPMGIFKSTASGIGSFLGSTFVDMKNALLAPAPSQTTNGGEMLDAGWQNLSSAVETAGTQLDDTIGTLQDSHASMLDKGVSVTQAGLDTLNALFTIITAPLAVVQKVPVVGYAATAVNNIFGALGKGGADIASKALDGLPISDESKAKLQPVVQQLGALTAQLLAGKGGDALLPDIADKSKIVLNTVTDDVKTQIPQHVSTDDLTEHNTQVAQSKLEQGATPEMVQHELSAKMPSDQAKEVVQEAQTRTARTPEEAAAAHADYAKSMGYEPITPDAQLPTIDMGKGAVPDKNALPTIEEGASMPKSYTYESMPAEDKPAVLSETRSLYGKGLDYETAKQTAMARYNGRLKEPANGAKLTMVMDKTPADYQNDFTKSHSDFTSSQTDLQSKVDDLQKQLDQAKPRSQAKKDTKIKLSEAKKALTSSETEYHGSAKQSASTFTSEVEKYLKTAGVPEDAVSGLRAKIAQHITSPDLVKDHALEPVKVIADKVIKDSGVKLESPKEEGAKVEEKPTTEEKSAAETETQKKPDEGTTEEKKPAAETEAEKGKSGIGKSIEAKAIEQGLTKGFKDTAEYDKVSVKGQAEKVAKMLNESVDDTRAVIRGEKPLPDGVKGTSVVMGMEVYLKSHPDAEIAEELANSPLVRGTSEAAQEMRLAAERDPDSATARLQKLKSSLEEKAGSKSKVKTARAAVIKGAKAAVAKINLPDAEVSWDKFLDSITC